MIIVDSHVHFYSCFNESHFLESAYKNFSVEAQRLGVGRFAGFLLLTEGNQENWFSTLHQGCDNFDSSESLSSNAWTFQPTKEKYCLKAKGSNGERLFLVSGRQIVTAEKLEVLALFTNRKFKNGIPLVELVKDLNRYGEIVVIPWGTGKWLGKRGQFLKEFVVNQTGLNFFMGDNGGRPFFWPEPGHFKIARQKKIPILRGSDPLPLAAEAKRPGSFGFSIPGTLSEETPAKDLKEILITQELDIENYGKFEGGVRFFLNQVLLRLAG
jgi:hypothetical protein